jgi:hypothetical protein
MVDPVFWAVTSTPSIFWPVGELIVPAKSWSAEAVTGANAADVAKALANNRARDVMRKPPMVIRYPVPSP